MSERCSRSSVSFRLAYCSQTWTEWTELNFIVAFTIWNCCVLIVAFCTADANGNGSIDLDELQLCFKELQVSFGSEEVQAFYAECDMDSSHGIDFKEFIVVLALVYLLGAPPTSSGASSQGEIHVSFQCKRAQGAQGMNFRSSILLFQGIVTGFWDMERPSNLTSFQVKVTAKNNHHN